MVHILSPAAHAQPAIAPWPNSQADTPLVAAAPVSGVYATASNVSDAVEVRDIRGALLAQITTAQIQAQCPWMQLSSGPDGPVGLALSDSGRLLFVAVRDAVLGPNGETGAILRLDVGTGQINRFLTLDLPGSETQATPIGMAHFKGQLYVATSTGTQSQIRAYFAQGSQTTGAITSTATIPGTSAPARSIVIDRNTPRLYAAADSTVYWSSFSGAVPISFTALGSIPDLRGMAWSDQVGPVGRNGLYMLTGADVRYLPISSAQPGQPFAPTTPYTLAQSTDALAAMADGRLMLGQAGGIAQTLADPTDTRLGFEAWVADEFQQVVAFAKGLASKPGIPAGWVIDTEIPAGVSGFPASPDGAGWVVLLLIANHRLTGDPAALPLVRTILTRYAGLASDGIAPSRTPDGIYRHWINPQNGQAFPGWDPEFATLSTMKIVAAASRARSYWPADPVIERAASRIICTIQNEDAYVQDNSPWASYFKGLPAGGPDLASQTTGFNETIIFVEQLGAYGSQSSADAYARWLERFRWPTATYLTGRSITGDSGGNFLPAFVSLYPLILQPAYRGANDWSRQISNLRDSNAAWTDDNGPQYNTVFSAGTSNTAWGFGSYFADNLGTFPGRVSTFTSLMAFASSGRTPEAVAAHNAYRRGARQTWASGASILYRRSDQTRTWVPNSAGLPDVALGALGLAELLEPGLTSAILARPYEPCPMCYANCDGSTIVPTLNALDFACFLGRYQAGSPLANCDGSTILPALNALDFACFLGRYQAGCP